MVHALQVGLSGSFAKVAEVLVTLQYSVQALGGSLDFGQAVARMFQNNKLFECLETYATYKKFDYRKLIGVPARGDGDNVGKRNDRSPEGKSNFKNKKARPVEGSSWPVGISEEDKGRASGKPCTACGKEGHFLRHHRKPKFTSYKAVSKTDWVRQEEMYALTDLVTIVKDSISAVANVVIKKYAGGNVSKGSESPGSFCKLFDVEGHSL